jgi:hypothetical protein
VKTIFKKLTVLASSVMLAAVGLATMPATSASAAGSLKPWNGYVNINNSGGNQSNSTGEYTLPGGNLSANFSYSTRVPFGTVAAGDVLSLKLKLVKTSDNSAFELRQNGCTESTDLWLPTQGNCMGGWSNVQTELTYTHTVTQADVTAGIFTTFNTSGYSGANNNYQMNYQYFGFYLVTPDDSTAVKIIPTWTKNSTVVTPQANNTYYYMSVNAAFENADDGFDISSELSAFYVPANNQNISNTGINTGGCIDTTGLTVGQRLVVDYRFTVDGALVPSVNNWGNTSMSWNIGNMGMTGVQDEDYGSFNIQNTSEATMTLPALTQKMIDGAKTGANKTNVTNVISFYMNSWGVRLNAGHYELSLKAHVQGQSTNLLRNCDSTDVVNLSSTKQANGDIVIKFSEAGTGKYDIASFHYCQLRPNNRNTQNERWAFIGGAPAMEVTPATSPRSFTCTLRGLDADKSYNLAVGNLLGNSGWANDLQYTWLSVKSSPNVANDAKLESVGIGSATTDVYFDPAVTTYNLTSEDDVTPYPSVVTANSTATYVVKLGGTTVAKPNNLNLALGRNVVTIEVTCGTGKKTYTFNITKVNTSADATLASLSFSGKTITPAFSSATTSYSASVGSSVSTYPFPNAEATQEGATVVVKQGGTVVTGPGALTLAEGANVITVEVTAKNGTTKKIYTTTITRAAAAKDASLSALPTVTGVTVTPTFSADVTSYTASVSEGTKTASLAAATTTVNAATVVYKLNGVVVTAPATLNLRPGANTLETIVTSSDGTTTKTYTETITRAVLAAGSSTAANEARLAVSPVPGANYTAGDGTTVTGFDSDILNYTKAVPVNQENIALTAAAANSSAVITYRYSTDNGANWTTVAAPGPVPLADGKTTKIETTVTNGTGTKVYITDVTRPAIDPNAEVGPTEGDGDTPAKGIAGTGKFIASNDPTFQLAWTKATGKLVSQATGVYIGYIEAKITFTKAGKAYTCTAQFGTIKALPAKTAADKLAAMKSKTFAGKQFCIDKTKLDPKTTAPVGGFTTANFKKIKPMNKLAAELTQEAAALAALKGFSGEVQVQVTRYRAWPSTMVNLGNWDSKGGRISVQIRNTKVALN